LDAEWQKVILNGWAAGQFHKRWFFVQGLELKESGYWVGQALFFVPVTAQRRSDAGLALAAPGRMAVIFFGAD